MFERFTESARRALFFARYECSHLGSSSIDSEHLLLGLLRTSEGIVPRVLQLRGVSADEIRRTIEAKAPRGEKLPTSVEVPFSLDAKRVLEATVEEADALGHSYIGTEHLLLGLLRNEGSAAASLLGESGLRLLDARSTIVSILSDAASAVSPEIRALSEEIDRVKLLVTWLSETSDRTEAAALVNEIHRALDALRDRLKA
jgi:ATP-dependent Clp protease ATP-binding subunit ClpC